MHDLAENLTLSVAATSTERSRQRRARNKELRYGRTDWSLFLREDTLPQKAGCQPDELRAMVLKEIVDNALDACGSCSFEFNEEMEMWIITGTGIGPDPLEIPELFCVNRELLSSKTKRMPTRGMLGNGLRVAMGAVHALGGLIIVTSAGHRLALEVDPTDGSTKVVTDLEDPESQALSVMINLGPDQEPEDGEYARNVLEAADPAREYAGHSSPWWYGPRDFELLLQTVDLEEATVSDVVKDLGLSVPSADWTGPAKTLPFDDCKKLLEGLRKIYKPVKPEDLGSLGQYAYDYHGYDCQAGIMNSQSGAQVPYIAEVWADASPTEKKGDIEADVTDQPDTGDQTDACDPVIGRRDDQAQRLRDRSSDQAQERPLRDSDFLGDALCAAGRGWQRTGLGPFQLPDRCCDSESLFNGLRAPSQTQRRDADQGSFFPSDGRSLHACLGRRRVTGQSPADHVRGQTRNPDVNRPQRTGRRLFYSEDGPRLLGGIPG
jgi:hypothetical protein